MMGKVAVDERLCMGGEHVLPVLALRFGGRGMPALSDSAPMLAVETTKTVRFASRHTHERKHLFRFCMPLLQLYKLRDFTHDQIVAGGGSLPA